MKKMPSPQELRDLLAHVVAQNEDPETGDRDLLAECYEILDALPLEGDLLEVEQVAVLSTAHMPSTSPDFGDLLINEYDEGYNVYVSTPEGMSGVTLPEWLSPIVAACHAHGVIRLNFDSDGPRNPNFRQYEW